MKTPQTLTLAELANQTGLAARTIRFYIARGLLDGPSVSGRGAVYTHEHLERLRQIQALQAAGATLNEIAFQVPREHNAPPLSLPDPWQGYGLTSDVTVLVRGGVPPWHMHQIRTALHEFALRLHQIKKNKKTNTGD